MQQRLILLDIQAQLIFADSAKKNDVLYAVVKKFSMIR